MRKFLIVPGLAFVIAAAATAGAFASDDDVRTDAPREKWLSTDQITEKFKSQGYDVRQVKVEDGGYEIYALDKDGKRVEASVDPVTGELLKTKADD